MKRSIWLGYSIAPITGPLLYAIISLFIPSINESKEFSVLSWLLSLLFFSFISYIVCLIFGTPLISALKKYNKLKLQWVLIPGSVIYSITLYITIFHILGGKITGNQIYVIGYTLLIGFGLGSIVSLVFCTIIGIIPKKSKVIEK